MANTLRGLDIPVQATPVARTFLSVLGGSVMDWARTGLSVLRTQVHYLKAEEANRL